MQCNGVQASVTESSRHGRLTVQFVKVIYPSTRRVNVDRVPLGDTGEILKMDAGNRIFDLDGDADYEPSTQTVRISGTTKANPKIVVFAPLIATTVETDEEAPVEVGRKTAQRIGVRETAPPKMTMKKAAKKSSKKATKKVTGKPAKKAVKKSAPKTAKKTDRKSAKKAMKKAAKKVTGKRARKRS